LEGTFKGHLDQSLREWGDSLEETGAPACPGDSDGCLPLQQVTNTKSPGVSTRDTSLPA